MPPEQDPAETRRQQFLEYLQQQQALFQQREQQSSNLLALLSQSNPTEASGWNLSPNLSSDLAATSTTPSLVQIGYQDLEAWSNVPQNPFSQEYTPFEQEEDELINDEKDDERVMSGSVPRLSYDEMPTTSEFVKKLYRTLEDTRFQHIMSWGPSGDSFVIKDMQECTKTVLPRLFKHSNFSSFVRQLNKYGFRKMKSTEGSQYGEHSWVFYHSDFRAGHPEDLEKIKRKASAPRKSATESTLAPPSMPPPSIPPPSSSQPTSATTSPLLRRRFSAPHSSQSTSASQPTPPTAISQDLKDRLRTLERNQEGILGELVDFQQGLAARNDIIQSLILRVIQGRDTSETSSPNPGSGSNPIPQPYPSAGIQPSGSGTQPQQGPSNITQDPRTLFSNNNFRLLQQSFDPGNLSSPSGSGQQFQPTLSHSRSHRRYSANDAEAFDGYPFDEDPDVKEYQFG